MLNAAHIGAIWHFIRSQHQTGHGLRLRGLAAEIAQYADDGAQLAIANGWLEEPPQADDRDELATKK